MATSLRVEDRLDGASNYSAWRARITLLLKECKLWDVVNNATTNPVTIPSDATTKAVYDKKNVKAQRILLDAIKDHVIPHVSTKDNVFQMWDALTSMYRSSNANRKMVLKEKLRSIKMGKDESMTTYLTKITQVRDELGAVGEKVEDSEMVRQALNGVVVPWAVFVQSIIARENLPKWDRLWDDFTQEEIRRGYIQGSASATPKEEDVALATGGKQRGI
jgi:hypothetical protein